MDVFSGSEYVFVHKKTHTHTGVGIQWRSGFAEGVCILLGIGWHLGAHTILFAFCSEAGMRDGVRLREEIAFPQGQEGTECTGWDRTRQDMTGQDRRRQVCTGSRRADGKGQGKLSHIPGDCDWLREEFTNLFSSLLPVIIVATFWQNNVKWNEGKGQNRINSWLVFSLLPQRCAVDKRKMNQTQ